MAEYPESTPEFVVYVDRNIPEGQTGTLIGAVDLNKLRDNVIAIIDELGHNPRGEYFNVKLRLNAIEDLSHTQNTDTQLKNGEVNISESNDINILCGTPNKLQLFDDDNDGISLTVDASSARVNIQTTDDINRIYFDGQLEVNDYIRSNLGFRFGGTLGISEEITVIVALRDNAGSIEYKDRVLKYEGGIITSSGAVSDWKSL